MRLGSVGALCASLVVVMAAAPVAAETLEREHYTDEATDTFIVTDCGAPITIAYVRESSGLFMLKAGRGGDPTPYFFDNYSAVETYTNVANGKTLTIEHQGLYKDIRIERVEGTVYHFTAIETGRPVVAIGPEGKRVTFDRGRIQYSFAVDTKGDTDLSNDEFVEDIEPDVAGPHPFFFGEVDPCDLINLLR
jgi:hypothetical protein